MIFVWNPLRVSDSLLFLALCLVCFSGPVEGAPAQGPVLKFSAERSPTPQEKSWFEEDIRWLSRLPEPLLAGSSLCSMGPRS